MFLVLKIRRYAKIAFQYVVVTQTDKLHKFDLLQVEDINDVTEIPRPIIFC